MVQRRGAKPNPARPTSVFELCKFVRFSHAPYEKVPILQWRQCGAFAPHWRQGKVVR